MFRGTSISGGASWVGGAIGDGVAVVASADLEHVLGVGGADESVLCEKDGDGPAEEAEDLFLCHVDYIILVIFFGRVGLWCCQK